MLHVRVAGDEEVGPAVAVHVGDRRARVPAERDDARLPRALRERSVAMAPEQHVVGRRRHVEIGVAVTVEVGGNAALAAERQARARPGGDVHEAPAVVAIQRTRGQPAVRLPGRQVVVGVGVDGEEVEPTVVVEIEPADASAHHRGRVVRDAEAERSLAEVEADLLRHVGQAEARERRPRRRRRREHRPGCAPERPARPDLAQPVRPAGELRDGNRRALTLAGLEPDAHAAVCVRPPVEVGEEVARDPPRVALVELRLHAAGREDRNRRECSRHRALRRRGRAGRAVRDDERGRVRRDRQCGGGGQPRSSHPPAGERDHAEERPRRTHDREGPEQGDLRRVLRPKRRDQQGSEQAHADGVGDARPLALRRRLRIGEHEEEEDQDLRRGEKDQPEGAARDRAEVPACGHRVPGRGERADPGRERRPEPDGDPEQLEAREDREAAYDDDGEGEPEPRRHRAPPEVERLRPAAAEDEEAEDEADVRWIEDMTAAPLDHVLREQRDRSGPDVEPPAAEAPPVAVVRARDTEDERHAVPGQECTGGPHEHVLLPQGDSDLQHRARRDGEQDLRDREPEVERDLSEHLERRDHRREMEPRVAQLGQDDRVRPAPDREREAAGGRCGMRAHPTMVDASHAKDE